MRCKKVRLIVSGRVQGVGFRYSTFALAQSLGDIYGRVWNNDDGTVEILAQSDDSAKMAKFIQEIRKGPSKWAKVPTSMSKWLILKTILIFKLPTNSINKTTDVLRNTEKTVK